MAKNKKEKEKDFLDLENNRYGLFWNEQSFNLEVEFGREYINKDINNFVTLHRIDVIKSKVDDLYGEADADEKVFQKPVKLRGMVDIQAGDQKYVSNGGVVRDDSGELIFRVYLKELEERGVEINRGDILAYNLSGGKERYYEVSNANAVTDETDKTIAGMKPYWKKIVAVPVKGDVVPFV